MQFSGISTTSLYIDWLSGILILNKTNMEKPISTAKLRIRKRKASTANQTKKGVRLAWSRVSRGLWRGRRGSRDQSLSALWMLVAISRGKRLQRWKKNSKNSLYLFLSNKLKFWGIIEFGFQEQACQTQIFGLELKNCFWA